MANTSAFNETMHHTNARLRFIVSTPNEFLDFKHKTQPINFCTDCFNKIGPKFKWIYHFYMILFERNKNCRYSNRITHKMMERREVCVICSFFDSVVAKLVAIHPLFNPLLRICESHKILSQHDYDISSFSMFWHLFARVTVSIVYSRIDWLLSEHFHTLRISFFTIYLSRIGLVATMGKRKYNAKGRQVNQMIIDNTETKQVNWNQIRWF